MRRRLEVRFYAELNDFLPPDRRGRPITLEVAAGTTVKDLAESFGVPHTEIEVILVNGESVDFVDQVGEGDRVSVYPVFEALDVSPLVLLRPRPLREPGRPTSISAGSPESYDSSASIPCGETTSPTTSWRRSRWWRSGSSSPGIEAC